MNPEEKLQHLNNLLDKDALRINFTVVPLCIGTYQQIVHQINDEYNTSVCHIRVKNYLNSLRVSTFVDKVFHTFAALAKAYKTILNLSLQCPISHRGDAHKIVFLKQAMVGLNWSLKRLQRVASQQLTFQKLCAKPEAVLLLHIQN